MTEYLHPKSPEKISRRLFNTIALAAAVTTPFALKEGVRAEGNEAHAETLKTQKLAELKGLNSLSSKELYELSGGNEADIQRILAIMRSNGYDSLEHFTPQHQYAICLLAGLNHSESSWPTMPYKNLAPQLVEMDLTTQYLQAGGGAIPHTLDDIGNKLKPENGFIFSALWRAEIPDYLAAKVGELTASDYAKNVFSLHAIVAANALANYKEGEPYYFPHFKAKKIFDPASDPPEVLPDQVRWIEGQEDLVTARFKKMQTQDWFVAASMRADVPELDPLAGYYVSQEYLIESMQSS